LIRCGEEGNGAHAIFVGEEKKESFVHPEEREEGRHRAEWKLCEAGIKGTVSLSRRGKGCLRTCQETGGPDLVCGCAQGGRRKMGKGKGGLGAPWHDKKGGKKKKRVKYTVTLCRNEKIRKSPG